MQFLDNRVYPNLYADTIWEITNNSEREVFGFTLPKPKPKVIYKKDVESEEDKKAFEDYYTNLLEDYKSIGVIPWFK